MEKCKHCKRDKPDYIADPSCAKGGYCEWQNQPPSVTVTHLNGSKVTPIDVSWATGSGIAGGGYHMHWAFPNTAAVEGLEVVPWRDLKYPSGFNGDYNGFITSMRIGNNEYLHIAPYPILMWSPGMPNVDLWLPAVPKGHNFSLTTKGFFGKIRPRGLLLNP